MESGTADRQSVSRKTEVLRVSKVRKSFGEAPVLKEVSFALYEGEILGVIGPSGGGKTTLLRCVDILETIDSGTIEYGLGGGFIATSEGVRDVQGEAAGAGSTPSDDPAIRLRREIGFVFQAYNLWEDRTVLGNLALAPKVVSKLGPEDTTRRAAALCDTFGLSGKLDAYPWQLSGGQQQRVAIARALMMEPKLVLLDEITSALDPVLTVEVMEAIRKLRDRGLTMIIVSHHIEFISSICDRVMFLSGGAVVQLDTPDALGARPATEEVRRFLDILRAAR